MSKLLINDERCKACGYCVEACPVGALSLQRVEGKLYDVSVVDPDKCITCGSCYRVCPDLCFEIVED